jgi:ABC-type nickel/cobalt efflux system permease component RcnA
MRSWLALLRLALVAVAALFLSVAATAQSPAPSVAQPKSPFAAPLGSVQRPAAAPAAEVGTWTRLQAWVQSKQAEYNRSLVQAVRRFKTENAFAAAGALALISFLYGVFHAVGPGHGKAIISSYVLANERTARRGVLIAFISSLFQALSAIAIVGVLAIVLNQTAKEMQAAELWIERASYALVAAVGAWLLYAQLRGWWTGKPAHSLAHTHGTAGGHAHDHAHRHAEPHGHAAHHHRHGHAGPDGQKGHGHHHGHAHSHDHAHDHAHEDCEHCGHQHLPGPAELDKGWSWKRALALSFAVGIRPCTGAILVLVFALTQGLFWAGVGATFAMALGTAITVSLLAVLAVASRELAARLSGGSGRWVERVYALAGIGGSALILVLGLLLLMGSFGAARPF